MSERSSGPVIRHLGSERDGADGGADDAPVRATSASRRARMVLIAVGVGCR